MAEKRMIGDELVIGIRPTIDGRRGTLKVRELLEEQTMGMVKAAMRLFEENLKYSNGEPVKVVIADTTIGHKEASRAYAIVATSETAVYANIMLQKGNIKRKY